MVPNTPPRIVPIGKSRPVDSSHHRPSHTATPILPAMVNVMLEKRKKLFLFGFEERFKGSKMSAVRIKPLPFVVAQPSPLARMTVHGSPP